MNEIIFNELYSIAEKEVQGSSSAVAGMGIEVGLTYAGDSGSGLLIEIYFIFDDVFKTKIINDPLLSLEVIENCFFYLEGFNVRKL